MLTFNGVTKRIDISAATTMSVRDLWSRAVDWWLTSDNSKFIFPLAQVGGNDIDLGAGTKVPIYAFLMSGWRVKPQEAHHTLNVIDGILLVDGGGDPFVNTSGSFIVRVNYQQPVQAISFSTGGGGGATPASIWGHAVEGTLSAEQIMRVMAAALAGKVSGAAGTSVTIRAADDSADRITATVDASGNRTAVTLNPG